MADQTMNQAYVAALAELANPKKNQSADTGRYSYSYADLAQVIDLTRPVLARHGLAAVQDVQMNDGHLYVWTYILHSSGDQMTFGPITGRSGGDWQQLGAAITYCRRYALMAALGLAAEGEDTDAAVNGQPVAIPAEKPQDWQRTTQPQMDDPWQTPEQGENAAVAVAEQHLGAKVLVPNTVTGPLARKMVKDGHAPATEKQLAFVRKLAIAKAEEFGQQPIEVVNAYLADAGLATVEKTDEMTKGQASAFIEAVKA